MSEAELHQQLAETAGELKTAGVELVRLGSSIDRHAQDLTAHQVQLDRHAQKLERLASANPEALSEARRAHDVARATRERVDLALGVLEAHGTALEALKKTLHAHGGMLKKLLSSGVRRPLPKPKLKMLKGGRASSPGPSPKRRG